MRPRGLRLLLGGLLLLHGCAALPTGPNVLVLPGAGTPLEEFQRDDRECQGYAAQQLPTGAQAGTLQWRYDMAYVQCMYAKGHRVPDGAPSPPSPQTVPPPPAPGPPRS
jgi:hypothetical protein